jgi:hypothetical protein
MLSMMKIIVIINQLINQSINSLINHQFIIFQLLIVLLYSQSINSIPLYYSDFYYLIIELTTDYISFIYSLN